MEGRNVELTKAEKLIVCMLADLHIKNAIKPDEAEFVRQAVLDGQEWAITWKLDEIYADDHEISEPVQEVMDILDMWEFVELSVAALSPSEKAELEEKYRGSTGFEGFDKHNEPDQHMITHYLVEKLERFDRFHGRKHDLHSSKLRRYRAMLTKFRGMDNSGESRELLSVQELLKVFADD